ncbi:DUF2691 family protein [Sporosarcina sp. G11-34]|uniref:DUF2691 family protein n=1 Tax=Sporosarcina sp. G11-34 TaxID=2849605 RepID=UPI0022A954E2|nr:DUF2691 family protein [Sporosarcina sp. G11-34]MCZ2260827.1 DUF2691 family protein [Sporosarcina sp. G11-34]
MRGVSFEIPNKYGKQLFDILKEVDVSRWDWQIGGGEAYIIENGTLGKDLFGTITSLTGKELFKLISENEYYLIFADLKAYMNVESELKVETYEDFLESDCQFVLLLLDSSYVTIYSKSKFTIQSFYDQAVAAKYEKVEYITDDNDERTTLIAF